MATLKFSTGSIKLQKDAEDTLLGIAQEITINYSSSGKEFRGGDYDYPVDIQLGDLSCEITVKSSKWDINPDLLDNETYSIIISAGKQSGGSTGTITNCKLVDFTVTQKQDEYVLTDLTFKKLTDLT